MDDFTAIAYVSMARDPSLTCMSRLTMALKAIDHYEKELGIDRVEIISEHGNAE